MFGVLNLLLRKTTNCSKKISSGKRMNGSNMCACVRHFENFMDSSLLTSRIIPGFYTHWIWHMKQVETRGEMALATQGPLRRLQLPQLAVPSLQLQRHPMKTQSGKSMQLRERVQQKTMCLHCHYRCSIYSKWNKKMKKRQSIHREILKAHHQSMIIMRKLKLYEYTQAYMHGINDKF